LYVACTVTAIVVSSAAARKVVPIAVASPPRRTVSAIRSAAKYRLEFVIVAVPLTLILPPRSSHSEIVPVPPKLTVCTVPSITSPDIIAAPATVTLTASRIDVPSAAPSIVSDAVSSTLILPSPPARSVVPLGTKNLKIPLATAVKPAVSIVVEAGRQRVACSSCRNP
jgi:hypothetical protein